MLVIAGVGEREETAAAQGWWPRVLSWLPFGFVQIVHDFCDVLSLKTSVSLSKVLK